MDFRDLIKKDDWTLPPKKWRDVDAEMLIMASIHRYMHFGPHSYLTEDIWRDPLAATLCKNVGTNILTIRNDGFRIAASLAPNVFQPMSFIDADLKEVSPAFMQRVVTDIMSDDRKKSAVESIRVVMPKTQKAIESGVILGNASLCIAATLLVWDNLTKQHSNFEILPMLFATCSTRAILFSTRNKLKQMQALLRFENTVRATVSSHWLKAAMQSDLRNSSIHMLRVDGGSAEGKILEIRPESRESVNKTLDEAEHWAFNNRGSSDAAYAIETQSVNPDLGSTTFTLSVFPPLPLEPPDKPDSRSKKPRGEQKSILSWLPGLAPRPV